MGNRVIFVSWISNNHDQRAQNYFPCYNLCNYVIIRSTTWKRTTEAVFWVDEDEIWFLRLCRDLSNLVYILPVGVMATTIRDAECTNQLLSVAAISAVLLSVLI
jgi:hypothetical protein